MGVINTIAGAINASAGEHIVEIGPGQGALTEALLSNGATLDVIELDRDLVPGLLAAFSIKPNFSLHSADALTFDYLKLHALKLHALKLHADSQEKSALSGANSALRIVGNLPYNISTPLIFKLLENTAIVADMHFMLQKEVVDRLAAAPGSKLWGRLGIMAQYHCEVESLFDVPPSAFRPEPKVQSAVVRLTPWKNSPWPACDENVLRNLVRAAFSQRRKTLRNNLKGIIDSASLETLGVDPSARAETLELTQFIEIANNLYVEN